MPDSPAQRILDTVLEGLVLALLVWLPFAFGGVEPLSHEIAVAVAGVAALLLGLRIVLASGGIAWSWALLPLLAYVGLVALQLVPVSLATLDGIAPTTAQTWRDLLSSPPLADGPPTMGTLSLYPAGTEADLRLLLVGAVLFAAGVVVFRDADRLRRLLTTMVAAGAGVAAIGVAQILTEAPGIYWVEGQGNANPTAGPFRHYGHYSQFLNLCIGAGLGLILMRLSQRTGRDRFDAVELIADLRAPERRTELLVVAFLALAMVAIAMSRSRNGVISLLVAGATMAACMQGSRFARGMSWPLLALVVVSFCTLLVFGFDPVYERMSTLGEVDDAYSGRLAILGDTMTMVSDYPAWGVGQGAFEYAFPVYDQSVRGGRAEHAENQFAEVLAESGVVGAAIVVAFLVLVVWTVGRRMWRRAESGDSVLFGLGFGAVAVGFHALTDFGLRIPAVAALLSVFLGAACGRAGGMLVSGAFARYGQAAVGAVAGLALLSMLPATDRARRAYDHWEQAQAIEEALRDDPAGEGQEPEIADERVRGVFVELRDHLRDAVGLVPGDVEYRLTAALAEWNLAVAEALDERIASQQLDPLAVSGPIEGDELSPENSPALVPEARKVVDALLEARVTCPTYGLLWSMAGQLAVVWLGEEAGDEWIDRGLAFAPQNPGACIASGRKALRCGEDEAAVHAFRRALQVGASWPEVSEVLLSEVERPEIARDVARGDALLLSRLDAALTAMQGEGLAELAREVRAEARALLEERARQPSPPAWVFQRLARYAYEAAEFDESVTYYKQFLVRAPNHRDRLELAQLLFDLGDRETAIDQSRQMLNYNPGHAQATRLLELWRSGKGTKRPLPEPPAPK